MKMTSRERILRAIEWRTPDRVPLQHVVTGHALATYGVRVDEIRQAFPSDCGGCGQRRLDIDRTAPGDQTDKWGCVWRNILPGEIGYVAKCPLSSWKDKDRLRFPQPRDLFDFSCIGETLRRDRKPLFRVGTAQWLWHRMIWLRGFEALMIDLSEAVEEVIWLRDRVARVQQGILEELLEFEMDGVWFWEDWGTQDGLMFRPQTWRDLLKETYAKQFALVHEAGKKVFFHTCGNVSAIVPDLVAIGADVLNIQVPVMDSDFLSREMRGKACVLGGLDLQNICVRGDPREVEKHVLGLLDHFARPEGGYIAQAYFDAGIPIEATRVMTETAMNYRTEKTAE